ncbi:MAG: hypothetical protein WAX04_09160 [Oscillospiraceae bacterium]
MINCEMMSGIPYYEPMELRKYTIPHLQQEGLKEIVTDGSKVMRKLIKENFIQGSLMEWRTYL